MARAAGGQSRRPFLVTRAVLPGMQARRRGKIIMSFARVRHQRPQIVACDQQGRSDADPRAGRGGGANVQVNGVAPGFFKTEMKRHSSPTRNSRRGGQADAGWPLGRAARDAARRSCVERGRLRHRTLLYVDGGFSDLIDGASISRAL
jgi:NAD(P)-dependent dehydrogenase (short-subunit alcohol dehydrogenase family)